MQLYVDYKIQLNPVGLYNLIQSRVIYRLDIDWFFLVENAKLLIAFLNLRRRKNMNYFGMQRFDCKLCSKLLLETEPEVGRVWSENHLCCFSFKGAFHLSDRWFLKIFLSGCLMTFQIHLNMFRFRKHPFWCSRNRKGHPYQDWNIPKSFLVNSLLKWSNFFKCFVFFWKVM